MYRNYCSMTAIVIIIILRISYVCVCAEDESEEEESEDNADFFSLILAKLLSVHSARNRAVRWALGSAAVTQLTLEARGLNTNLRQDRMLLHGIAGPDRNGRVTVWTRQTTTRTCHVRPLRVSTVQLFISPLLYYIVYM